MKKIKLYSIVLLFFAVCWGVTSCTPPESGEGNGSTTTMADSVDTTDSIPGIALQADSQAVVDSTLDSTIASLEEPTPPENAKVAAEEPKGNDKNKVTDNTTSTARFDKCYLKVSFISMASGPDAKSGERLKTEMKAFEKAENLELTFEIRRWGREGEHDYCFSSLGLTDSQREKWATKIRKSFKGNDMVLVSK